MLLAVTPKVEQRRTLRFFTLLPGVVGILVAVIGAASIVVNLAGVLPTRPPSAWDKFLMMPITAVGFIIAGLALAAAQKKDSRLWTWVSRILAAIVGGMSLFALLERE